MYLGSVYIVLYLVWNAEKVSPQSHLWYGIANCLNKNTYILLITELISITIIINHDLFMKIVSQFRKKKQHVAPVHKNTTELFPK